MKNASILTCILFIFFVAPAQQKALELNKEYNGIHLSKTNVRNYDFNLTEGGVYQFSILHKALLYIICLQDLNNLLYESNYPEAIQLR